jgi:hypothetical protein
MMAILTVQLTNVTEKHCIEKTLLHGACGFLGNRMFGTTWECLLWNQKLEEDSAGRLLRCEQCLKHQHSIQREFTKELE